VPNPKGLVITVSQSGETADTIAALHYAKSLGHRYALSICNVPESSLVRASDLRFLTRAGPEIGVASTKAFTTQLAALALLTMTSPRCEGGCRRSAKWSCCIRFGTCREPWSGCCTSSRR